jgi:hypothetical protein
MTEFEMKCNARVTPLNSYLVLYETTNDKGEPKIVKTTMVCPSITHVVVRFPSSVKIELLSDAYVSIAPIIAPKLGEETDAEIPAPVEMGKRIAAQLSEAAAAAFDQARAPVVPFLPGLRLCRVCKFNPFKTADKKCSSPVKGHRFDTDPATKQCEQFQPA